MNKAISNLLSPGKTQNLEKGMDLMTQKGSIKELPLVLNLLNQDIENSLEQRIVELISNIKDKKASEIIIDFIIETQDSPSNLNAILQACWQSQLDFTQHLLLFTQIFIKSDYLTSFEAFTLIENIWQDYTYEEKHQVLLIDLLKDSCSGLDNDKLVLTKELIAVLEA